MTPERWQQIDALLEEALARPAGERSAFLDQACAGDESLRGKVEALLAAHGKAESFIETSALAAAAQALAAQARSMAGRQLGHYQILALLGAGGMGEVYRARDTKLGRLVALKFLPATVGADRDRMQRFVREARAASAINHPNVATIYEIGKTDGINFIAMEYVEGQTLQARLGGDPIDPAEVVGFGIQMADALAEAHAKGITHRDIKPANLMLNERGQVKVLDFGLAKITRAAEQPEGGASALAETAPGIVMGTVRYMSPEQVLGRELDHRTDIFSLGVVLYEMATGRAPFSGVSAGETMDQILHASPAPLSQFNNLAPTELEWIVRKCLEKERERRYQSARELLVDLQNLKRDSSAGVSASGRATQASPNRTRRNLLLALALLVLVSAGLALFAWLNQPKAEAIDSIAVLPFANASVGSESEYLSDGITESLINSLSQLSRLRVVARPTAFRYKGREMDPLKVGEELKVRAVLTGRMIVRDETMSIQVDLVDTATGTQLWGERYNRKLGDLLALHDEIARHILEQLRLKLTNQERLRFAKRYTENTEAYRLYLLGRFHWSKWTEEGVKKSIDCFNQALAKDPNYALAHFGLFDAYTILGQIGVSRPNEVYPKALVYAEKALALDPTLPEAHSALGAYELWYGRNWTIAEQELKRAMEPNTNVAGVHTLYGQLLVAMGRFDEAIAENKRALDFEPLSPIVHSSLGGVYYLARQYDRAIAQCRKALELDPSFFPASVQIGWAYGQQGNYQDAIVELTKTSGLPGGLAPATSELGYVYAVSGQRHEAHKLLQQLQQRAAREFVDPYFIAIIHAGLGDPEQTFIWLNKAYEERSWWLVRMKVEPKFDRMRTDPRFANLVQRLGLQP